MIKTNKIMDKKYLPYQRHYSPSNLWNKLADVAKKAGRKVVYYVLVLYYVAQDPNVPTKVKLQIYGTLGYFILPLDLIPDLTPGIGYSDDLAALMWCFKLVKDYTTPEIEAKVEAKLNEFFN